MAAITPPVILTALGLAFFKLSLGMEPGAGPGLLFMTIPLVFSKMMFGNILLVASFWLTAMAMISLVEVLVAYFIEERGFTRRNAVLLNSVIIVIIGSLATLSADKSSLLGGISVFGKGFFGLFDYISSNILLPVGGLLVALFIGYIVKKDELKAELSNNGTVKTAWIIDGYYFIIRYVTPALLIIVFLNSIGLIKF